MFVNNCLFKYLNFFSIFFDFSSLFYPPRENLHTRRRNIAHIRTRIRGRAKLIKLLSFASLLVVLKIWQLTI